MSEVRLVPRFVVLYAAALLIGACARSATAPAPTPDPARGTGLRPFASNPCATGHPAANKQAPIVCIDDSNRTLVADPDRVFVHDVKSDDMRSPVPIQWYTKSGTGDVHVKMAPGCTAVNVKTCNGNGKCEAETTPGAKTECKYDVWITGGKHDKLDPTVVVDSCCG
jgi:hypothetical protein